MNDDSAPLPTRDERLAARLRDNLRRRKQQARGQVAGEPAGNDPALPKPPPGS